MSDSNTLPAFDKKLFLAGLAVGRQLKGWSTVHRALPTGIEVITPPTLREYADGAAIDFTGLEVVLRTSDGARYTDRNYPDGVIPMSELAFPVTHAHYDGTGAQTAGEFYVGDTLACRSLYSEARDVTLEDINAHNYHDPVAKLFREGVGYGEWFIFWNHVPFRVAYRGNRNFLIAAAGDGEGRVHGEYDTNIGVSWYTAVAGASQYVFDGKEVCYFNLGHYADYLVEPYLEPSEIADLGAAAWAMVFGGLDEKKAIPVEWTAPPTRFSALPTMRDSFSVLVHENEE